METAQTLGRFISWRPRRRRLPRIVIYILLSSALVLYILFSSRTHPYSNIRFTAENRTLYRNLSQGWCILSPHGGWNCPDNRLAGENFIRRSQLVIIRLLLIFDAVAKRHKLRYWISRGTLLGAARYKGFIPWDIDLDIVLPNEDYFRFVHLLQQGLVKLPYDSFLHRHKLELDFAAKTGHINSASGILQYELPPSTPFNPRLRDRKSCYKWCIVRPRRCNWEDGLMVDIYPVTIQDNVYPDPLLKGVSHKVFPLREISFEGYTFPATTEWETQLKQIYGEDYLTPPPQREQIPIDEEQPDPQHPCSDYVLSLFGKAKLKSVASE